MKIQYKMRSKNHIDKHIVKMPIEYAQLMSTNIEYLMVICIGIELQIIVE